MDQFSGGRTGAKLEHKKKENSITEIYAPLDPSYLGQALEAIENFLSELLVEPSEKPLISLPNRFPKENPKSGQSLDFIGAGDE
ncbi:MAG: hypothetical protein AAF709_08455, partial [Pseudomonadota bacterium]